jgi:phage terminase large subunit
LLVLAHEQPARILCCREIQGSIKESAYRLLSDQIRLLGLDEHYEIQADSIIGRSGSRFFFEGLRHNTSRIRIYEGVDLCWVEEAQSVSDRSWEELIPTVMRKKGCRFVISYNPLTVDDPCAKRFVESERSDVIARKVSWRDNPYLAEEARARRPPAFSSAGLWSRPAL